MFRNHPTGLFRLFFIEMWERLAFYTMVGVLLLYATDTESGGLGWSKSVGNEIYGLYLAFVYFTPYLGGLIADRFLGYRKSVLIGGLLFATGFFLLATGQKWSFPTGLVFLCCGNGLFKPNISAMVGNLYQKGDPKRDAGFNIFYMGINIGAFFANFLVAYMRNAFWWEMVFVAAGVGMLLSVVILGWSWKTLERADRVPGTNPEDTPFGEIMMKILAPSLAVGVAGWALANYVLPAWLTKLVKPTDFGFLLGAIPILLFFVNLSKKATEAEKPGLNALLPVYLAGGTFFMVLHLNGSAMTTWANDSTARHLGLNDPVVLIADAVTVKGKPVFAGEAYPGYYGNAAADVPRPHQSMLLPIASTEQARMFGQKRLDEANLAELRGMLPADVRKAEPKEFAAYLVTQATFDKLYAGNPPVLPPGEYLRTANSELYQSWNAFFVIVMTPLVMLFFGWLLARKIDFSTARKILVGMVVTALSALFMAFAGFVSDNGAVKVSGLWLMGFYCIVTVGELCLSPMALSLVTKLSPKRFVGLTMGGWFFATAVGNKFSGFLGVLQGAMADTPAMFFLVIAIAVALVAGYIFAVLPKLDAAIKKYGA